MASQFGKYILLQKVAESIMSQVYLARVDMPGDLNRIVALKTLHPRFIEDHQSRSLFFKEIEVSMALRHPNIVQIYDFGEQEGLPYIAMEWISGKDLRQILARVKKIENSSLSTSVATWIILQISKALCYAHQFQDPLTEGKVSIVHSDVSPHNIILSYAGEVKLIDFGIAGLKKGSGDTETQPSMGKLNYLSLEVIKGVPLVPRSDIFSLGAVFWELLSGKKLFDGSSYGIVVDQIRNYKKTIEDKVALFPEIPKHLLDMIFLCLNQASSEEVVNQLRNWMKTHGSTVKKSEISQWVSQIFLEEKKQEEVRFHNYGYAAKKSPKIDVEKPPQTDPPKEDLNGASIEFEKAQKLIVRRKWRRVLLSLILFLVGVSFILSRQKTTEVGLSVNSSLLPRSTDSYGTLVIKSHPSSLRVKITNQKTGRVWESQTPIEHLKVPPGNYQVKIFLFSEFSWAVENVKVTSGSSALVVRNLFPHWLNF